jgi:hypothetical protein
MPRREGRFILDSLKRREVLRRGTSRRKRRPLHVEATQSSVMQKRIDALASVTGLAGVLGGSVIATLDNPTGWIAVAAGIVLEATSLTQILKAESHPRESYSYTSSARLSFSNSGPTPSDEHTGLPLPDAYAAFRFMEQNFPPTDNSES